MLSFRRLILKDFLARSEPETVIEGTFELKDGKFSNRRQNMQAATGYNLVVTPAAEEIWSNRRWFQIPRGI